MFCMQSENRLFDDFVKVMNGAAGTIAGMGREAEASIKERAKEWMGGLDFVSRDEFEAVKAMAAAAREEAASLRTRLDAMERRSGSPQDLGASDFGSPSL
jgi:BMFP domain-containing protein YqiC